MTGRSGRSTTCLPLRMTVSVWGVPSLPVITERICSGPLLTPSMATTRSPALRPACSAGELPSTSVTRGVTLAACGMPVTATTDSTRNAIARFMTGPARITINRFLRGLRQ